MTRQNPVNVAGEFDDKIEGVILSKEDGDTRVGTRFP